MNSMNRQFRLSIIVLAIVVLCVVFAPAMNEVWASHDLAGMKPSVELHASRTSITLPCPTSMHSISGSCPETFDASVSLNVAAEGFGQRAVYKYSVTVGHIVGEGSRVSWDLAGIGPGYCVVKVDVSDGGKRQTTASLTVTISQCGNCVITCDLPCPTIAVTCYDQVKAGTPITCKIYAQGGSPKCNATVGWSPEHPRYKWSVRSSNGDDLSETITSKDQYVSVPTNGRSGQTIYTTVEVLGLDSTCSSTTSSSTKVN
jgi:hypothetical protein